MGRCAGRRGRWGRVTGWEKTSWRGSGASGVCAPGADAFKLSADPDFEAKLRDVIGLYSDPPERAAVFSFDEKTQALDRTQPSLPMVKGPNRAVTHDYKRNGAIDLFAALNVATGQVLHQTRKRRTGNDVLAFFKWLDLHTAPSRSPRRIGQPLRAQVRTRAQMARKP